MIGGPWTFIAFKNPTSYAIGSSYSPLQVLEEALVIYKKRSRGKCELLDMIYIDHLDCYLLSYRNEILRKEIDGNDPYPMMRVDYLARRGATLRYSKLNKRLVFYFENSIRVVNIEKGKSRLR